MMKKKIFGLILFGIILTAGHVPRVSAAPTANPGEMCPVMPGHAVKQKFFVDYKGRRIHLCCRSCVKAFKKNPEKFLHAAAVQNK